MQNKSVLNKEQERESRSCSLFNTDLSCTKRGGTQEMLFVQIIKKINLSERGGYIEPRLLPKKYGNRKQIVKKVEKNHFYKN